MNDNAVKPYPLISEAIRSGNASAVIDLLKRYPNMIDLKVPGFGTWLHYAAGYGTTEIVKLFIELGFDVNAIEDIGGLRPLINAVDRGNIEVAEYLLDHGAVMDTDASVRSPLFAAIAAKSPRIVRLLLDRGLNATVRYNTETMDDMDAIAFALECGEGKIAEMIASHVGGNDPEKIGNLIAEADAIMRRNDRLGQPEKY